MAKIVKSDYRLADFIKMRGWRKPPGAAKLADLVAFGDRTNSMVIVYVIRGTTCKSRYVGITKNLKERLERHNSSRNKSTKNRGPFKLIYSEDFSDYVEARKREKFFKSGAGRKFLDTLKS